MSFTDSSECSRLVGEGPHLREDLLETEFVLLRAIASRTITMHCQSNTPRALLEKCLFVGLGGV